MVEKGKGKEEERKELIEEDKQIPRVSERIASKRMKEVKEIKLNLKNSFSK